MNLAPEARLVGLALVADDDSTSLEIRWTGADPDGVVDHYLYTTGASSGAAGADWQTTDRTWVRLPLPGGVELEPGAGTEWVLSPLVTLPDEILALDVLRSFALRAVDDLGAASPVVRVLDHLADVPPAVTLVHPAAGEGGAARVFCSEVTCRWEGFDGNASSPDGKPAGYQMKLVALASISAPDDEVLAAVAGERNLLIPDSLIVPSQVPTGAGTYHEEDWFPKASVPYESESYRLVAPGDGPFALAVRAIDEDGHVTPDSTFAIAASGRGGNIIKLDVRSGEPVAWSLEIRDRRSGIAWRFDPGAAAVDTEVPSGVAYRFEWDGARGACGEEPRLEYAAALDIPDPDCADCLAGNGIGGWTDWSGVTEFPSDIAFSPAQAGERHLLHVKMRDPGLPAPFEARVTLALDVIGESFTEPALWIDDFVSGEISDCDHDAILAPILDHAVAPFTGSAPIARWSSRGGAPCAEEGPPDAPPFDLLMRHRLIFWNVRAGEGGSALGLVTDPATATDLGRRLAHYVQMGGGLIVWGDATVGALLGDFYPSSEGYIPALPEYPGANFGPGSFVWDVLRLRTQCDRVGRPGLLRTLSCSGIVGMEATTGAIAEGFPPGVLDPTGYSTDPGNQIVHPRTAIWFDRWFGRTNARGGAGPALPVGVPPLHVEGLDTLYTYVSNAWAHIEDGPFSVRAICGTSMGSPFEREPVIVRRADPAGVHGRVVFIGTPLYFFAARHDLDLALLLRRLAEWVMETRRASAPAARPITSAG